MMSLRIHYDLYGSIALHCLLSTETQGLLCGNRFNLKKEVYPPLPCPSPLKEKPTIILILTLVHPAGASRTLNAKKNVRTKSFKKNKRQNKYPEFAAGGFANWNRNREQQNSLACFCLVENFQKRKKTARGKGWRFTSADSGRKRCGWSETLAPGQMISFFLCVCVCVVHLKRKTKRIKEIKSPLWHTSCTMLSCFFFVFKENVSVQLFNFFQNF